MRGTANSTSPLSPARSVTKTCVSRHSIAHGWRSCNVARGSTTTILSTATAFANLRATRSRASRVAPVLSSKTTRQHHGMSTGSLLSSRATVRRRPLPVLIPLMVLPIPTKRKRCHHVPNRRGEKKRPRGVRGLCVRPSPARRRTSRTLRAGRGRSSSRTSHESRAAGPSQLRSPRCGGCSLQQRRRSRCTRCRRYPR